MKYFNSVLIVVAVLLSIVACQQKDDEAVIAEKINEIIDAIESEQRRDLLEYFSDKVIVQNQLGKQDVGALAFRYFYTHENIRLYVSFIKIEPDAQKKRATVSAKVLLTSGQKRVPDRAGLYEVYGQWRKLQGNWVIAKMNWQRLPDAEK